MYLIRYCTTVLTRYYIQENISYCAVSWSTQYTYTHAAAPLIVWLPVVQVDTKRELSPPGPRQLSPGFISVRLARDSCLPALSQSVWPATVVSRLYSPPGPRQLSPRFISVRLARDSCLPAVSQSAWPATVVSRLYLSPPSLVPRPFPHLTARTCG